MPVAVNDIQVSLLVPAYNETQSLVYNVRRALSMNPEIMEVIIMVSALASPETLAVCEELAAADPKITYYLQRQNPGLGHALREGFALVRGSHVQILYADCESNPDFIPQFIDQAKATDADAVVGSRWTGKTRITGYPPVRYFFNRAYQQFFRILFGTPLHDLTFGYNLLKTSMVCNINWQGEKHEIATEMVLKPLKCGYVLKEIPVSWQRRDQGQSMLQLSRYLYYPWMALLILFSPRSALCRRPPGEPAASQLSPLEELSHG